jgi:hypothetical protein
VQEAALARDLVFICGQRLLTFNFMWSAATFSQYLNDVRDAAGNLVDTSLFRNNATALHIRQLLRDNSVASAWKLMFAAMATALFHDCLLPEDRVRGLVGLVQSPDLADVLAHTGSTVNILYTKCPKYLLLTVSPRESQWWGLSQLCFHVRSERWPTILGARSTSHGIQV